MFAAQRAVGAGSGGSAVLRETLPPGFCAADTEFGKVSIQAQCDPAPVEIFHRHAIGLSCQRAGEPLERNGVRTVSACRICGFRPPA